MSSDLIIAQLSDPHVLEPGAVEFVDNNAMLRLVVESLNAEAVQPTVVLGTGDLTCWGRERQYQELADILAPLNAPFLAMVGNHDDRSFMRETFPDTPWADAEHASWVHEFDGITLIGLDSTSPGRHGPTFDADRQAWLENALATASSPVILAMHHPPFESGIDWMDADGALGRNELRQTISGSPAIVLRILSGHLHRPIVTTFAGVTASVCPATTYHVALDLEPAAKPRVVRDPRGYQLHLISDANVLTHTRYIDTGEAPFDPEWND
ncbi:MAG: phosphodiesterase [Actinobacteria bacterium]|nr:phosphodiesterase [Actinomycetota bacterium]